MIYEITIEELQEMCSCLYYEFGVENMKITEELKCGTKNNYIVAGLSINIENDIIMFIDKKDIILKNSRLLRGFLVKNLSSIKIVRDVHRQLEIIEFVNGDIVSIENT